MYLLFLKMSTMLAPHAIPFTAIHLHWRTYVLQSKLEWYSTISAKINSQTLKEVNNYDRQICQLLVFLLLSTASFLSFFFLSLPSPCTHYEYWGLLPALYNNNELPVDGLDPRPWPCLGYEQTALSIDGIGDFPVNSVMGRVWPYHGPIKVQMGQHCPISAMFTGFWFNGPS